jgi:hypothetical protein
MLADRTPYPGSSVSYLQQSKRTPDTACSAYQAWSATHELPPLSDELIGKVEERARVFVLELAERATGTAGRLLWPSEFRDPRYASLLAGEVAALAVRLLDELAVTYGLTVRDALDRFVPQPPRSVPRRSSVKPWVWWRVG